MSNSVFWTFFEVYMRQFWNVILVLYIREFHLCWPVPGRMYDIYSFVCTSIDHGCVSRLCKNARTAPTKSYMALTEAMKHCCCHPRQGRRWTFPVYTWVYIGYIYHGGVSHPGDIFLKFRERTCDRKCRQHSVVL